MLEFLLQMCLKGWGDEGTLNSADSAQEIGRRLFLRMPFSPSASATTPSETPQPLIPNSDHGGALLIHKRFGTNRPTSCPSHQEYLTYKKTQPP